MFLKKAEFFVMRKITNKTLMDSITNMKARGIGKTAIQGNTSGLIKEENKPVHVNNLNKNGFTVMDLKLSAEKVAEIIDYSKKINCYDTYRSETTPVDPYNPPAEAHVANYRREDLVKFKAIMDIANDPSVLQVVQDFLGATPTISNINMWWSFGGRKQAEHAQLYHRDLDDWKFCKLFVYLTDVSEKSGPHIYVKGTSQSPLFRKIRRYSDAEVEATFGKENVMRFVEPKGTAFIVDTYGFHKGLLPESDNRLLLQVQYSLFPIGIEKYVSVKIDNNQYNKYINRLIVEN